MLRPVIYRATEGSSGEKIVEMIAQKLSRLSYNLHFDAQGDVVTVISMQAPMSMSDYFTKRMSQKEIKELIRML
ncbi:hypothetical protein AYK24_00335 [Thermoplasmatales archaeon SG8-52-4]|nr:MAG: hypothetical protein AYK24_00335 [Thermoplasmatales archaeon SG8-52-4]